MKIIYDEKFCIQQYEECVRKHKRWKMVSWTLPVFAGCLWSVVEMILIFGGIISIDTGIYFTAAGACVIIMAFILCVASSKSFHTPIGFQYYLLTRDYKILKHKIRVFERTLTLVLEDEEGDVSRESISGIDIVFSTSIDEDTLNLNEGVYYIPYKKAGDGCKPNTDVI